MKTKLILLAGATCAGVLFAGPAHASDWYGALRVGEADARAETGGFGLDLEGDAYEAALGLAFGNGLRIEGSVDQTDVSANLMGLPIDGEATTYAISAELDFNRDGKLRPFIGAGYHYTEADVSILSGILSDSGDGSGWHGDLGLAYTFANGITAEARYRGSLGEPTEVDFDAIGPVDLDMERVTIGFRANF